MQIALTILWLAGPTLLLASALAGLWRRWQLLRDPMPTDGVVEEVHPVGGPDADVPMVMLRVACADAGRQGSLWVTRVGREAEEITIGAIVPVICQRMEPSNVIDARAHPWDDVIGPVVLAVLLMIFMLWLGLFGWSLLVTWGIVG